MGIGLWIILIIILVLFAVMIDLFLGYSINHKKLPTFSPPSRHCDVELYMDGRHFFDAFSDAVNRAKKHVHGEFFIFREDTLGDEIIALLKQKAKEGVTVRLLMDSVGSHGFTKKTVQELKATGVEVAFTAKPAFPFFLYHLNCRNHCKITVIDGDTSFYGGFNVGDEYLGKNPKLGVWRDYHLKVAGEGVRDLQEQFLRDWRQASGNNPDEKSLFPELHKGKSSVKLLPTYGKDLEEPFFDHLNRAQKSIFIGSPYFIPSRRLQQLLIDKLEAGVEVTLLLPAKKDHALVKPASYHYFKPLVERGCRIYHFYQGFYHAKVFIVDQVNCYLGTANFDMRSFFWNIEINGFIYDKKLIKEIDNMTQIDLMRSMELEEKEVTNRSFLEKTKTALSILFAPLL